MVTSAWPHVIADYPAAYVAYIKEKHGLTDDADALSWLEAMGEEPADVPHNIIAPKWGEAVIFEKGVAPVSTYRVYIGEAWDEIAFDAAGEVYFEYATGEEVDVAEKINFCRRMFKGRFDVMAWNALDMTNPALSKYFIGIFEAADHATWKLVYQ
jgi:hypothetical protein